MPTSSTLTEQLAVLGVHLPAWPEEPEGPEASGDWIQRGQAYAEGVRLWRAQLRNAPESTMEVFSKLVHHLSETRQLGKWDLWVATAVIARTDEQADDEEWIFRSAAHGACQMTKAQLLAASLIEVSEENWLPAAEAIQYLIEFKIEDPKLIPILISILIEEEHGSQRPMPNKKTEFNDWIEEVQHQIKLTSALSSSIHHEIADNDSCNLPSTRKTILDKISLLESHSNVSDATRKQSLSCLALRAEVARQQINDGSKAIGLKVIENVVEEASIATQAKTSESSWKQILINSAANRTEGSGRILLIESKSLPRSGHHYLKSVLQAAALGNFSYCEYYQEPGCCKQTPCNAEPYWRHARNQETGHVRFVKSHDFELEDPAYVNPDGVIRIVQVRQPLQILASWLELEQLNLNKKLLLNHGISLNRIWLYHEKELLQAAYELIDIHGATMEQETAAKWITEKTGYIIGFTRKWIPLCSSASDMSNQSAGSYLVRYEDLGEASSKLASVLCGQASNEQLSATNQPSKFDPRKDSFSKRRSKKCEALLHQVQEELKAAEQIISTNWRQWDLLSRYTIE